MKKTVVLWAAVAAFGAVLVALETRMSQAGQDPAIGQSQELTWEGYLVDVKTAADMVSDASTASQKAAEYLKETALKLGPDNGFGIIAGGQWLRFDAAGNTQAQQVINSSNKEKGIKVLVTGKLYGDTIAVTSIREVTEEEKQQQYN